MVIDTLINGLVSFLVVYVAFEAILKMANGLRAGVRVEAAKVAEIPEVNVPDYDELFEEFDRICERSQAKAMPVAVVATVNIQPVSIKAEEFGLESMSIRELKALARERKVKGYSNLTKAQLIERMG